MWSNFVIRRSFAKGPLQAAASVAMFLAAVMGVWLPVLAWDCPCRHQSDHEPHALVHHHPGETGAEGPNEHPDQHEPCDCVFCRAVKNPGQLTASTDAPELLVMPDDLAPVATARFAGEGVVGLFARPSQHFRYLKC